MATPLLPITWRELQVQSRRSRVYKLRTIMALLPLVLAVMLLWLPTIMDAPPLEGRAFFLLLAWISFAFCLLGGALATVDSLSAEKREGTLGLLFLTSLRGHDIVLGKLTSSGLPMVYGLVASFPALALPLLLGGVGLPEFGRTILALLVLLLLSLSFGLFVSNLTTNASRGLLIVGVSVLVSTLGFAGLAEILRRHTSNA